MISIIIPVYNSQVHLATTLDSILAQTDKNYELILINDGSTDTSETICKSYETKFKKLTYIYQENNGASAARNKGLDIAQGDFIQLFDADDIMHPKMLEWGREAILKSQSDIQLFDFVRFNSTELNSIEDLFTDDYTTELATIHKDANVLPIEKLVLKYGFGTPRGIYKREAIGKHRYDVTITNNEDHLFNYQLLVQGKKFSYMPKILMYYRMHNTPGRATLQSGSAASVLKASKKMLSSLSTLEDKDLEQFGKQAIADKLAHTSLKYLSKENKDLCFEIAQIANELRTDNLFASRKFGVNQLISFIGLKNVLKILLLRRN